MKIYVLLLFSFFHHHILAQVSTSAFSTMFVIRDDDGRELEKKELTLFYKFEYGSKDMKSCKGVLFTPAGTDAQSELIQGFSVFINTDNWVYLQGVVSDGSAYKNICNMMYKPRNGTSYIQANREIILIKYFDGSSIFMIIGYDNNNTIVLRPSVR